jgi:predicted phosphodiesterase
MRLAVLSDVHGNLQALEAVLDHAQKAQVDQIIIAGDLMIGLADSKACWDLIQSLNIPMIRGNHERYLVHYGTEKLNWSGERFLPIAWTQKQFGPNERQQIEGLPLHLHLDNLLIVHASYRDDYDTIKPDTPVEELEKMFLGSDETFILRGHNHLSFSVQFNNRHIESLGSAGLPLDGSAEADYIILEKHRDVWNIEKQEIDYDQETAINYLEQGGPIARLFLQELLTSRWQLIPFLDNYQQWSKNETLTLTQAVDAFIASQT